MTSLTASTTRIPPKVFNDVAFRNARVVIERRYGEKVVLISTRELELLDALMDHYDNEAADKALAEMQTTGRQPVTLGQVRKELGL